MVMVSTRLWWIILCRHSTALVSMYDILCWYHLPKVTPFKQTKANAGEDINRFPQSDAMLHQIILSNRWISQLNLVKHELLEFSLVPKPVL